MEKILVTGGLGFIGSHTVDRLIETGYHVRILDNLEMQVHARSIPNYINRDAEFVRGDIRFRKHWLKALDGVDGIIHLAGAVGISQSFWEAKKYVDINVGGTTLLYEIMTKEKTIRNRIEKIVVASSKSLYGEGSYRCSEHGLQAPNVRSIDQLEKKEWEVKCPICNAVMSPVGVKEDKPAQNLNPYSLSKYATERLAMDFSYALGIPTVAFRYFNAYGERQSLNNPYTGVMAIFLSRLKNRNSPLLFEDGNQLRDYIHVSDVARLNVNALTLGNGVYNLGTGKPSSLLEIVSLLNNKLGTSIAPKIPGMFRVGDNRHDYADMTKLKKDFGTIDFVTLEEGISRLCKWAERSKAIDKFEKAEKERKRYLEN